MKMKGKAEEGIIIEMLMNWSGSKCCVPNNTKDILFIFVVGDFGLDSNILEFGW
jgi:hypothetical protein